jgi:hypothetical protein
MPRSVEQGWLERLRKLLDGFLAPAPRTSPVPVPVRVRPGSSPSRD